MSKPIHFTLPSEKWQQLRQELYTCLLAVALWDVLPHSEPSPATGHAIGTCCPVSFSGWTPRIRKKDLAFDGEIRTVSGCFGDHQVQKTPGVSGHWEVMFTFEQIKFCIIVYTS